MSTSGLVTMAVKVVPWDAGTPVCAGVHFSGGRLLVGEITPDGVTSIREEGCDHELSV